MVTPNGICTVAGHIKWSAPRGNGRDCPRPQGLLRTGLPPGQRLDQAGKEASATSEDPRLRPVVPSPNWVPQSCLSLLGA